MPERTLFHGMYEQALHNPNCHALTLGANCISYTSSKFLVSMSREKQRGSFLTSRVSQSSFDVSHLPVTQKTFCFFVWRNMRPTIDAEESTRAINRVLALSVKGFKNKAKASNSAVRFVSMNKERKCEAAHVMGVSPRFFLID